MFDGRTALIAIELVAASIWVGSLVCLALVSNVARRVLDGPSRVAFFRGIGRLYGIVGTASLVIAIVLGAALAWPLSERSGAVAAALVLSVALLIITGVGMAQARRMTDLRLLALREPGNPTAVRAVSQGATLAVALRGSIGLVTLAIVVLVARVLAR